MGSQAAPKHSTSLQFAAAHSAMSWKVGWGEPMSGEQAIASVCHRRLDPLSLVQLQEVLTYRWQSAHEHHEPRQLPRLGHAGGHAGSLPSLPGYPRHRLNVESSSPAPNRPGPAALESPSAPSAPSAPRAPYAHHARTRLPTMGPSPTTASSRGLPELRHEPGASPAAALRAAASVPDFAKSGGFHRERRSDRGSILR